jgi:hypothetical protein
MHRSGASVPMLAVTTMLLMCTIISGRLFVKGGITHVQPSVQCDGLSSPPAGPSAPFTSGLVVRTEK